MIKYYHHKMYNEKILNLIFKVLVIIILIAIYLKISYQNENNHSDNKNIQTAQVIDSTLVSSKDKDIDFSEPYLIPYLDTDLYIPLYKVEE